MGFFHFFLIFQNSFCTLDKNSSGSLIVIFLKYYFTTRPQVREYMGFYIYLKYTYYDRLR